MNKTNTKKLAIAAVFCAVAVVGSLFSVPVFGSKCSPVQHMVNILCAVLHRTGLWTGAAFAAAPDPKSVRTWKPDGISGQYVWRLDLRTGLQENAECVRNFDR